MTTKTELLKIIRKQCISCCGGSYAEVETCQGGQRTSEFTECFLHPFRFGTDPSEVSEAKKEQGRKLASSLKAKKATIAEAV